LWFAVTRLEPFSARASFLLGVIIGHEVTSGLSPEFGEEDFVGGTKTPSDMAV